MKNDLDRSINSERCLPNYNNWLPADYNAPVPGEVTRLIKAKRFGHEGLSPVDKYTCPYRGKVCCVSGSGGSYCKGYGGDTPIRNSQLHTVRCLEEKDGDILRSTWLSSPKRFQN